MEEQMELTQAADIVQTISESLKSNPDQFHININVTGQQITSHGGTGLEITATGGGPKSTTVGQIVSMDGAQIEILRGKANQAMTEQITALINSLDEISKELRSSRLDKSRIQHLIDSLRGTWVPGVIIGVLSNILSSAIGI